MKPSLSQPNMPPVNVKDVILTKINSQSITPTPKWQFMCLACVMWVVWGTSVVLGAIAVAVLLFVTEHSMFALFEATHESYAAFVFDVLPYLWIGIFVLMAALAYIHYRKTSRGYRQSMIAVLGTSMGASMLLGAVLHIAGTGAYLDRMMSDMPMYESLEETERELWQQPTEGRLVGSQVAGSDVMQFQDIAGVVWDVDITEMQTADMELFKTGRQIRLLGLTASTQRVFYACGAFPWLFDTSITVGGLATERQAFVERMYAHKDNAVARAAALEASVLEQADPVTMSRCAELATIRRIGRSME